MERNIGEIFEYNGEWYQCVKSDTYCEDCIFNWNKGLCNSIIGNCDGIIFKKLEKVGEPIEYNGSFYQGYKAIDTAIDVCKFCVFSEISCGEAVVCDKGVFYIKIKQNQENMEERETLLPKEDNPLTRIVHAYMNGKISDKELIQTIKGMPDEYPYNKFTPFDLKAAKAGKPVCTRDGRKARIICFDRKGDMSITALITNKAIDNDNKVSEIEEVHFYYENGSCNEYQEYRYDLMMLPEKKEGWVNVYKDSVYNTKDEALIGRSESRGYIDTIKINWEE